MTRKLILIVDKDAGHKEELIEHLLPFNINVETAEDGESAWQSCQKMLPDLIISEVELPDMSGFAFSRRLSGGERTAGIPLIFSTFRDQEIDLVVGFELGAADYVSKKVSNRELALRVLRILSRTKGDSKNGITRIGRLDIDFDQSIVTRDGCAYNLSPTEFQVLAALVKARGRVLSRTEIIDHAWKGDGAVKRRTVDAHIKSLRAKLSEPGFTIVTIRGLGYCLRVHSSKETDHYPPLRTVRMDSRKLKERIPVELDCSQTGGN